MNILFVCLGNICRSPMAEFILRDLCEKQNRKDVAVESAATSSYERGNPVYAPAREMLYAHGISCAGKTSRQVRSDDYARFDRIYAMDTKNLRDLKRIFNGDPENKVSLLMDVCKESRDVADPWYTGDFDTAYRDIEKACQALMKELSASY
ncbi:MAG TPA: low molecular weight phosphotyrosine protein phosphatase [Candidatus Ruthenibacterium merdavium]|uniref:protein-tyrosine-phosphatase n=1 Tax=Candidatus Ruthenibacterium merdavium TaxID=2838752 RepID=A0A9D2TJP6_9FIRM|nr:low molecular weight phosphotyrosine protein phosphatase [Candidatus Ruthenibacterium merdavium]